MYSPKIKEELIPILYHMAKAKGTRMTILVNEIIQKGLDELEATEDNGDNGKRAQKCS